MFTVAVSVRVPAASNTKPVKRLDNQSHTSPGDYHSATSITLMNLKVRKQRSYRRDGGLWVRLRIWVQSLGRTCLRTHSLPRGFTSPQAPRDPNDHGLRTLTLYPLKLMFARMSVKAKGGWLTPCGNTQSCPCLQCIHDVGTKQNRWTTFPWKETWAFLNRTRRGEKGPGNQF